MNYHLRIRNLIAKNKLIISILLFALILRTVGLTPNINHPDEAHVQTYSQKLVYGIISNLDFNPHTFKYGSYIFYVNAFLYLPVILSGLIYKRIFDPSSLKSATTFQHQFEIILSESDSILLWLGRFSTAVVGALSVLVVYAIAKELFGKRVGYLSALILAIAPHHVRDSHYITTDVPFIFFLLLSAYALIKLYKTGKSKWYKLAGLFVGINLTIRYFPVTFLLIPLAALYRGEVTLNSFKKWANFLTFTVIGVVIGMPFFFTGAENFTLFIEEYNTFIKPWYETKITQFFTELIAYISSPAHSSLPNIYSLYPNHFKKFYVTYIFFNSYTPLLTLTAMLGYVILFFKHLKEAVFLLIVPLAVFVYTSMYIAPVYERLILPIIPFLAIGSAYFFDLLLKKFSENKNIFKKGLSLAFLALVIYLPLKISIKSSFACGNKITYKLAAEYIARNIPKDATISYLPPISFPSTPTYNLIQMYPDKNLSLEELDTKSEYVIFSNSNFEAFTYPYFNYMYITPEELYENSYYSLVMWEYFTRGELLERVGKEEMCDTSRVYIYKLAQKTEQTANTPIKVYDFNSVNQLQDWTEDKYYNEGESSLDLKSGNLIYNAKINSYTPPRLHTKPIKIHAGKTYTVHVKIDLNNTELPVFLRLDFYDKKDNSTITKSIKSMKRLARLIHDGNTQYYFEKTSMDRVNFSDTKLPGRVVAISKREKTLSGWQELSITSRSPKEAAYAIISIQSVSAQTLDLNIDEVILNESE